MIDNGYVYILINPSISGMVKIGKTTRTPEERAKELSSTTGVPTPFIVVYDCYFENCSEVELYIHTILEEKGYRVSKNREFFGIKIKDAIDAIIDAKNNYHVLIPSSNLSSDTPEISNGNNSEFFQIAENFYYGINGELQDYNEAISYYIKAVKVGSNNAYKKIAQMYTEGQGVSKNINKAIKYLKEGIQHKDTECYAEMAIIYTEKGHINNAEKCWNNFFNSTKNINYKYGYYYIIEFAKEHDINVEYLTQLSLIKEDILLYVDGQKTDAPYVHNYDETLSYINDIIN